jgi:hypothetical protein
VDTVTEPTPTFVAFVESLNAPRSSGTEVDNLNLAALAALEDDERARAETVLLAHLHSHPTDDRVAPALALIPSMAAIEPLRTAFKLSSGLSRLRVAQALAVLDASFDATPVYIAALATGDFAARIAAADALANDNDANVAEALTNALSDDHFDVRVHAFDALVRNLNLEPLKEAPYAPLREIRILLLSELHTVMRDGVAQMRRIVARLGTGETPEAVGLTDLPTQRDGLIDRVLRGLQRSDGNLDESLVGQLEGPAKRFVESALLSELHGHDPRIPRLLAAMHSVRAIPALEEAVQVAKGPIAEEIESALKILREHT